MHMILITFTATASGMYFVSCIIFVQIRLAAGADKVNRRLHNMHNER
jgi:hypothetical protein